MKILVVDSVPVACSTLARGLKKRRWAARHFAPHQPTRCYDACELRRTQSGSLSTRWNWARIEGLSFLQRVKAHCKAAAIRVPRFLILTPGALTGGYESRLRDLNTECLLFGFVQQVYATVRRMLFEAMCEKGRPTIIVDRSGAEPRFLILGAARSWLIPCGPRLIPIFNYLAIHYGTEISTRTLAEVADITEASVRVYLSRLRTRYDEARLKVGVEISGKEVFRTFRRDGAFVHVLSVRVLFR